ncbi:MAG: pentapeptide repeat-containing protein [Acidimicrobiia bacterium]|nr:pentapeptide repeat-containing protein [Acidimicrobiia bacterium]
MTRGYLISLTLLVGSITLTACGGGGSSSDATPASSTTSTMQESGLFEVPDGWQSAENGLSVAENRVDLGQPIPTGPRVVALDAENVDLSDLSADSVLLDGPVLGISVRGRPALGLTLEEAHATGVLVQRYLLVETEDGSPRLLVLEAPSDQWDAAVDTLARVVGLDEAEYTSAATGDADGDGRTDTEEMAIGQDPDVFTSRTCFELMGTQPSPPEIADLRGVDLTGADLAGCVLAGADLMGAILHGADLTATNLTLADLRDANLAAARLDGTVLVAANLAGADFTEADVQGSTFIGADLTGATLPDVWLSTICPDGTLSSDAADTCQP